jgi:hypothetical protein
MQYKEQHFAGSAQVLDGNEYESCKFHQCKMIYRGGPLPTINNCQFSECGWQLEDAAERTLVMLRLLYHGMGDNGPELVESALRLIREPKP